MQNFKLHLYPGQIFKANTLTLDGKHCSISLSCFCVFVLNFSCDVELPSSAKLVDVYSAFMNYVLIHTLKFLVQKGIDTESSEIVLILSHPNAWGHQEQVILRNAALNTKILCGKKVQVRFIAEANAIARYSLPPLEQLKFKVRVDIS